MKIGILTFHCAHNYGAVLQCFALQEYLKSLGHNVSVIDYRPRYLITPYKKHALFHWVSKSPVRFLFKLVTEPFLCLKRNKRWNAFNNFIKENFSLVPYSCNKSYSDFDCVIYGSDQIWNTHITGDTLDIVYWGSQINCRKIAYAASAGNCDFHLVDTHLLSNYLRNFSALSVRESDLISMLRPLTSRHIQIVSDPVFLLTKSQWNNYCKPINIENPYLLCYNLNGSEDCSKQANIICKDKGYDRVDLVPNVGFFNNNTKQCASPIDFISYFMHAQFVVTSSFHGTAFSILFEKPFYTINMGGRKNRVTSLLSLLGIKDRYRENCKTDFNEYVDWTTVKVKKHQYVRNSREYLNKNIQEKDD